MLGDSHYTVIVRLSIARRACPERSVGIDSVKQSYTRCHSEPCPELLPQFNRGIIAQGKFGEGVVMNLARFKDLSLSLSFRAVVRDLNQYRQ
jgi:hypothetical protein